MAPSDSVATERASQSAVLQAQVQAIKDCESLRPCPHCAELIQPGQPWHLDHRDDRSGYLGPSHATCNLRAAAHKRNGTRQDQQLIWSRVWYEPIPPNVVLSDYRVVFIPD